MADAKQGPPSPQTEEEDDERQVAEIEEVHRIVKKRIADTGDRLNEGLKDLQSVKSQYPSEREEVQIAIGEMRDIEKDIEAELKNAWGSLQELCKSPRIGFWPGDVEHRALWMWQEWRMISLMAYRKEKGFYKGWSEN